MADKGPALIIALAKKKIGEKLPPKEDDTQVVAEDILAAIKDGDPKALAESLRAFIDVSGGGMPESGSLRLGRHAGRRREALLYAGLFSARSLSAARHLE